MNRTQTVVAVTIVVIVIIATVIIVRDRDDRPETAIATLGTIDVTIQTVGTIQVPDARIERSSIAGIVAEMGATAGDRVSEGDIIAILDQQSFDAAVADAESQLAQAEYALQLAELRAAEQAGDRALSLDVLSAADRVERADRALSAAVDARRNAVIQATTSGIVIELNVRRGDTIAANQQIARIANAGDFRLIADVDELDLPNIVSGADVRFRLDAYPATEIEGNVVSTAAVARQQGGATVFATTIAFQSPNELDIRPGMNAEVTIVTDAREGVLLIPERALRTVSERSYVTVDTGEGLEEREVSLGYRGQGQVEVVDGLSAGERVVLR